jgi:poly(A) polymerase
LRLRADIEEVDERLADWWQEFSMASDAEREDLVQAAKAEQQAAQVAKPRVRRAPKPDGVASPAPIASRPAASEQENAEDGVLKKRRRRRRKPGTGGESGGGASDVGGID